jgi:hypothetical protein
MVQAQATMRQRMNFAVQHLMAAARFSRQVGKVEEENADAGFGQHFDELLHYTSACILSSVAALEAYANEFFADAATTLSAVPAHTLERLGTVIEQQSILDKFEIALAFKGDQQLDRGREPVQSIEVLIRTRNALMHFKPEWLDEPDTYRRLSNQLLGKFSPSPIVTGDIPIFPMKIATHSCTKWAVNSCIQFAEEFENIGQFPSKFSKFMDRLVP